jgi:ferredoxin
MCSSFNRQDCAVSKYKATGLFDEVVSSGGMQLRLPFIRIAHKISVMMIGFCKLRIYGVVGFHTNLRVKPACNLLNYRLHNTEGKTPAEFVNLNWINKDGSVVTKPAKIGANLLRTAQFHGIELEGACEGVTACSTCHCIMEKKVYDNLPEPTEEEEDMLDQAFGLTSTSRLGCQVIVTKDLDGITIKLPKATRNFYVVSFFPPLSASSSYAP